MKHLTYAVVGMGAIGGFYGAKLARAERELLFIDQQNTQNRS